MLQQINHWKTIKFFVVTGKGGTGKSLLATAIARQLAQEGRKTLLAEIATSDKQHFSRLHELLDCDPLVHKAQEIDDNLFAAQYHPMQALEEYVAIKIPGGKIAAKVLHNFAIKVFLQSIPGLFDLVSLGKIWYQLVRSSEYDAVVLDSHASGHALNMLRVPENFEKITKIGPLYQDAKNVRTFLENPQETAVFYLSIPEEMALSEANDYAKKLGKYYVPVHFVNRCFPPPETLAENASAEEEKAYRYFANRNQREAKVLQSFLVDQKNKPHEWHTEQLPFFFPKKIPLVRRMQRKIFDA